MLRRAQFLRLPRRLFSNAFGGMSLGDLSAIPTVTEMEEIMVNHCKISRTVNLADFDFNQTLPPRTMDESYRQVRIPLSTDKEMQKRYLNVAGMVRIGKVLEDLDRFAVYVSFAHNHAEGKRFEDGVGSLPRTIVTAGVHSIDMHRINLHPERDIIVDGATTWTGESSMESTLRVFQQDDKSSLQQILKARFTLVSRHTNDMSKKLRIHPLIARTPEEAALVNAGHEANKERAKMKDESLWKTYPTSDEMIFLHDTYLKGVRQRSDRMQYHFELNPDQTWLYDTLMEFSCICFPADQNLYGKIFGGFLMRQALELAYANTRIFCKSKVHVVSMDDISFRAPVEIGDVLHIKCLITYTEGPYMQCRVTAEVTGHETFLKKVTNVFHFTMKRTDGGDVLDVVPKHYDHGILMLSGKRRFERAMKHIINQ